MLQSDIEIKYDNRARCYNILPVSDNGKQWYIKTFKVLSKYGKLIGSMDSLNNFVASMLQSGLTVDTLKDTFPNN